MVKIPPASWKTKSFSIESCNNVRSCLRVQALTFQMWNGTLCYDRDLKFWTEINLDDLSEISRVDWGGPWGPSLCANTNPPHLPDGARPWGATTMDIYNAFAQMQMSFSAICTREQDSPGWRYGLCPAPCRGLEWTLTIAVPPAIIGYPHRPSSPSVC